VGRLAQMVAKAFRRAYVSRMLSCRRGEADEVPHEVLDPRDLKLYRNQTNCHWRPRMTLSSGGIACHSFGSVLPN
jgi:hypothetical protein